MKNRVKLFVVLVLLFTCAGSIDAQSVVVDDLLYSVVEGTDYASVKADSRDMVTANILSEVEIEGKAYKVRSIDVDAFKDCEGLTSIVIPEGVTEIGILAFGYCSGLTSIEIPSTVTSIGDGVFMGCSGLTSIEIPSSVTSIDISAFIGCYSLNSMVVAEGNKVYDSRENCNAIIETQTNTLFMGCKTTAIPSSVINIGELAFYGCSGLTSVVIPSSVTSIGDGAFLGCSGLTSVVIPEGVTEIRAGAFEDCSSLASIEIPSTVTSIDISAFWGCYSLNSMVVAEGNKVYDSRENCNAIIETKTNTLFMGCKTTAIPSSVTNIGEFAFWYCSGLTSVVIPSSVTSIGSLAFEGCSGLTSIEIPSTVTSIGDGAFLGCSGLTSVVIPSSVTSIGNVAFGDCSGLTSIEIPSSVTSIDISVFLGCYSLNSMVVAEGNKVYDSRENCNAIIETQTNTLFMGCKTTAIPSSVTNIGELAFYHCSGLTSVVIPSSVTSIGDDAFQGCSGLTSVVIPSSVTSIGGSAFYGCTSLGVVNMKGKTPPAAKDASFNTYETTVLIVPVGAKSAYQSADVWKNFATIREVGEGEIKDGDKFEKDGMFYTIISVEDKTVEVTFKGETYSEVNNEYSGEVIVPQTVNYEDIEFKVVGIGVGTFVDCKLLKSIVLPSSVTRIGNCAFGDCSGLTSIEIPKGITEIGSEAFSGCSGLTSIELPESVISIGDAAFGYCSALTSVKLSEGVISIGRCAFSECSALTSIEIPSSVTRIGDMAFYRCSGLTSIKIPEGVTIIDERTFFGCIGLESVIIPSSVTSIGEYAFFECFALKSIEIPENVTSIGGNVFFGCKGLTSIVIPSSVTSIGGFAFHSCSGLTSIEIPAKVTSIGTRAFGYCYSLESVVVAEGNEVYDSRENCNAIIETKTNNLILGCKTTTIPSSVTSIGEVSFYGCLGLTSIELPENVTSIGGEAFYGCSGLASINIKQITPPTAYDTSFDTYETTVLTVPAGAKSAYQSADVWKKFATIREVGEGEIKDGDKFEKDGIYYKIVSAKDKTVEVTYNGDDFRDLERYKGDVVIPLEVNYDGEDFYVIGIGDNAFTICIYLNTVKVSGGVNAAGYSISYIGKEAFTSSGLTAIELSDEITRIDVSAFSHTKLSEITLPQNLEKLESATFSNCTQLKSIRISAGITDIDASCFTGCSGLETIKVDPENPVYSSPDNCNAIINAENWLVTGCKNTVIPEGVKGLLYESFRGCTYLEYIEIPSSVNEIQDAVFHECPNLKVLNVKNATPALLSNNTFEEALYEDVALIIPSGASAAYSIANGWNKFHRIRERVTGGTENVELDNIAGTMKYVLDEIQNVKSLTVSGSLDGSDIRHIRSISGLERLDIKYSNIVAGGDDYVDGKKTEDGIVGDGMFDDMKNLRWLSLPQYGTCGNGVVNSETLRELYWNTTAALVKSVFMNPDVATNMILYINADAACDYDINVVRNGMADEIVLTDSLPLQITTSFNTKKISYTRYFDKVTEPHEPGGWESIVLPFDVQSFWSEEAGEIAPFNSGNAGAKPFMLAQMTAGGLAVATEMMANVPYVLAMPNSEAYYERDNISGRVTFSAESKIGVLVAPTTDAEMSMGKEFDLVPTYDNVAQNLSVYALNDKSYGDMLPGSAFVSGLRTVKPFEAYASVESKPANAKTYFVIGGNGTATDIQRLYDKVSDGLEVESREGVLYIHSAEAQKVSLYSSDGRLVRIVYLNKGVNTVTGLAKGIYMVGTKKVVMK